LDFPSIGQDVFFSGTGATGATGSTAGAAGVPATGAEAGAGATVLDAGATAGSVAAAGADVESAAKTNPLKTSTHKKAQILRIQPPRIIVENRKRQYQYSNMNA